MNYIWKKERKNVDSESWLFANIKDDTKQCNFNTFSESLKIICRKLDIKNITPKSLRRYFNTVLKRGKIDFEIRERLLGHKVDISKGSAYDEILNDSYKLAKYYSDKIESLTLLGNGNKRISKVDKRVEDLEIRNKGLERTVEELKENIKLMSKFLLSLEENFREALDDNYMPQENDLITFSIDEMKEFREKVKELFKK